MSLLLAFVVVVIALQLEGAKEAMDRAAFASLALFPRVGLIPRIAPVARRLQEEGHQRIGRLENRGADQHFELLDRHPVGSRGLETPDQLLDFLVLGEEELQRGIFFSSTRCRVGHFSVFLDWVTN